jgi:ribulose kinase
MGMIRITINGSFGNKGTKDFSAMEAGHAVALGKAIEYLASLLPDAIRNDHQCQHEGEYPQNRFGIK